MKLLGGLSSDRFSEYIFFSSYYFDVMYYIKNFSNLSLNLFFFLFVSNFE